MRLLRLSLSLSESALGIGELKSTTVTRRPKENEDLIRRVLSSNYLELDIKRLVLDEDFASGLSKITVYTADTNGGESAVDGEGCGLVDAIFNGLKSRYGKEYQSLNTVELVSFTVLAQLDTKQQSSGADAVGEVKVEVRNSKGTVFAFADASRSVATSTARAVLAVVEYFVNSERAFIMLYKSLKDAKERSRTDLVTRYTRELAEVVKSTSYAEVIETIQKELK